MVLRRIWAIVRVRSLEALRDKTGMGSTILLPLLIVAGFAFAFSGDSVALFAIGVHDGPAPFNTRAAVALKEVADSGLISVVPVATAEDGMVKLRQQRLDLVIDFESGRYVVGQSSSKAIVAEKLIRGIGIDADLRRDTLDVYPIRYVDWLLPGVLAMSMMFGASYGVVYAVVRYRRNGVLKRLKATPLTAGEFIAAQLLARIWLVLGTAVLVFVAIKPIIGFHMVGSYTDLLLVLTIGALSLAGLGLFAASWTESEEFAVNILNILSWIMMFLSGIWFAPENVGPHFRDAALFLPLTHFIEAARAVMLYGARTADVAQNLATLLMMSAAFIGMGTLLFRWK